MASLKRRHRPPSQSRAGWSGGGAGPHVARGAVLGKADPGFREQSRDVTCHSSKSSDCRLQAGTSQGLGDLVRVWYLGIRGTADLCERQASPFRHGWEQ